jgi:hypothetical protein
VTDAARFQVDGPASSPSRSDLDDWTTVAQNEPAVSWIFIHPSHEMLQAYLVLKLHRSTPCRE